MSALSHAVTDFALPGRRVVRVLVVEDNPGDIDLTEARLESTPQFRFDVVGTSSLIAASGYLSKHEVDVVLLDLDLPDSRGKESLRRLRQQFPNLPIVVLSGNGDEQIRTACLLDGAQDFIGKNDPPALLLTRSVLFAIAQKEIQSRSDYFEHLVKSNPDAVIVVDAEGSVRLVNDAAVELFGLREDDLVGEALGFSIESGKTSEIEIVSSGEPRVGEVHVADIEWGSGRAHVATIRDRTLERRLETEARQSQKMEAVGQLAGGVAHDFNNILAIIMGYANLLKSEKFSDEDTAEMLSEIVSASERAKALTSQLLAFSSSGRNRAEIIDVQPALDALHRMLYRILVDQVELLTTTLPDTGSICMDKTQFEQIMVNLVVNARDSMAGSGSVIVTASRTHLIQSSVIGGTTLDAGEYVRIAVSDSGAGMDELTMKRIFEPFFTTKEKGTGLGLPTVRRILAETRGAIEVTSELGHGSTFTLYLPAIDQASLSLDAEETQPASTGGTERVLYVEEDDVVRRLFCHVLGAAGYRVTECADAAQAIAAVQTSGVVFDLLLTADKTSTMSGTELAKQIREIGERQLPVVYVLGSAADTDDLRLSSGDLCLAKPLDCRELLRSIRKAVEKTTP